MKNKIRDQYTVTIDGETHKRLKILSAHYGKPMGKIVKSLITIDHRNLKPTKKINDK